MSNPSAAECRRLIRFVRTDALPSLLGTLTAAQQHWVGLHRYGAERGRVLALPTVVPADDCLFLVGCGDAEPTLELAQALPDQLPAGCYAIDCAESYPVPVRQSIALGFELGRYRFTRYRSTTAPVAELAPLAGTDRRLLGLLGEADRTARDLINTPAQDLGPAELAGAVRALAERHGALYREVAGEDLARECPAVAAVGRAGAQPPRLALLEAGSTGPLIALVGKGVCFDSGGLDLKPASGMALMKKDMGGAAVAIGLAALLLGAELPVRLILAIPAVENGIGPLAFRPGDVLATRKGLTVEVSNTDAEGRLVLADAICMAAEKQPDILLDFATLTGAARVALGPELPAMFASDDELSTAFLKAARSASDPVWPMPLWSPYEEELRSRVADLQNASASGFAGAISAALFLRRFVPANVPWLHFDLYGWNPKDRPGKPVGGDAQVLRAAFQYLQDRYALPATSDARN